MKAFFKSVANKVGYILAALIIFAAVCVCVTRLLTPVLDHHRADFEKWASEFLSTPITIDNVRVSWYQYQPVITFNQVTAFNKETHQPLIQVKRVRIFFSIPTSLWQRQLVPSGIMISGADIHAYQSAKGDITIQGFPLLQGFNGEPYKNETKFQDAIAWLSAQPRLILRNIDLRYTSANGQKRFVTLYDLSFENTKTQHTILGKAILHQEIPTEVMVAVQWLGEKADLAQIKAKAYLYISGLSLSQWLKGFSWQDWQVNNGIASAKIWATWNHGALHKVQSTLQFYELNLYSKTDKSVHKINRLSGNLGWKHEGKGQVIAGDDIFIDLPDHLWPATNFYVSLQPNAQGLLAPKTANVGYVDFHDLQSFLFSSPKILSADLINALQNLKIKGALQNAVITLGDPWTDWDKLSFTANFNRLRFSPWQKIPGMQNLSGQIKWNGKEGHLNFDSNQAILQYDALFPRPLNLDQISGNVSLLYDLNKGWSFNFAGLQMLNSDAALNINGSLFLPLKGSPVADLTTHFTLQKINRLYQYLPLRIMDPDLATWLKDAFLSGELRSGNAVIRGNLADFPFDKGNGTFLIEGFANNIDLHYADNWPNMKHTTGQLTFSGRRLVMNIDHAQILNVPLTKVYGEIPDLGSDKPQMLQVESKTIQSDFKEGMYFVHHSPLEETFGKMMQGIELKGPMALGLKMNVPISHPKDLTLEGDIGLNHTQMNLVPWKLVLNNLNGHLQFTEKTITANRIQGLLFNKPLQLDLKTIAKSKDVSVIRASATSALSMIDLENWLSIPITKVARGTAVFESDIDFSLKTPIEISLRSKLQGVTLDLPDQYGKQEQEERNFSANIILAEKQPLKMQLGYGDLLQGALVLDRKEDKFSLIGATLRLGAGKAEWPATSGLYITGNIEQLDWDKIKKYATQSGDSSALEGMKLRGIDVTINTLNLFSQELKKAKLQIVPLPAGWDIDINSSDVVGHIKAPAEFNAKTTLSADFQKLALYSMDNASANPLANLKTLPALSIFANNVTYNEIPLGQVTLKTSAMTNGLQINTLRVLSPRMNLFASGDWTENNTTHMHGNIVSNHVSDLLASFGVDAHNLIANKGKLIFDLSWQDLPFAPSLAGLNGRASLDLSQGRIVDVDAASGAKMDIGKMLSIFSLQTIPRRLSLDFSDVFQKGYSFDSIRGDFSFRKGDAFTNNMRIEGPIARVSIDGRIGLKNKDYDFTLSVTPYVTTTVPIAAATLVGAVAPWVGLAALAVNTVVSPGISKATTYYYEVTGPWSNPTWTSISANANR